MEEYDMKRDSTFESPGENRYVGRASKFRSRSGGGLYPDD